MTTRNQPYPKKLKLRRGVEVEGFITGRIYERVTTLTEDDPLIEVLGGRHLMREVNVFNRGGNDPHIKVIDSFDDFIPEKWVDDPEEVARALQRHQLDNVVGYRRETTSPGTLWDNNGVWIMPYRYERCKNGMYEAVFRKASTGADCRVPLTTLSGHTIQKARNMEIGIL